VINGVLTGQEPSNGSSSNRVPTGYAKTAHEVIQSAYSAFESGLHLALYVSAALVAGAGIIALVTIGVGADPVPSR